MPAGFPGLCKSVQCITDATADETLGPWVDVRGLTYIVFYLTGKGTTSSGVVTFEECGPNDMGIIPNTPIGETTGAYSAITTANASDVTGTTQKAYHMPVAGYCYVRARISTVIGGGGTVSVGMVAT